MADHAIGTFLFVFWDGDPPHLPQRQLANHTRPGVDGVGQQLTGTWGTQFEVIATAHLVSYPAAVANASLSHLLVGSGLVDIVYNQINYTASFSVRYSVDHYTPVRIESAALVGPGYFYPDGAILVGRFLLTPHAF